MQENLKKVLITEDEIAEKVKELGKRISEDYSRGKRLLLVSVLKGSIVFMADLIRQITIPCEIDFMSISSYGAGTVSTGNIKINKDLNIDVRDYDILVVEDILDSGLTLSKTLELLQSRGPRSIRLCTFLSKPDRRKVDIEADYTGFVIPDEFVVGYGLDYNEKFRNLPFVGVLKEECYR